MAKNKEEQHFIDSLPRDELATIIREATVSVENDLRLEDEGWTNIRAQSGTIITPASRINNLKLSRLYSTVDPLGRQAIRLWTDYTFGQGMAWDTEDEQARKALDGLWNARENKSTLSARGQRKSSDKALIDGEVFFAIFLGPKGTAAKLRTIDPLEITEIITNPDDVEDVKYYRRQWTDAQSKFHDDYYRDAGNIRNDGTSDSQGVYRKSTQDALVYHLAINTITQRGNPLLLPALDWIKYYRRYLASRIAIMLALAKFAWRTKVSGSQSQVDAVKAKTNEQDIPAASHLLENLGSDTQPIKTDTGASQAYQDGRMIKLQVAAAVGIPEQYFGDISIGNLATAKTVELPMMKMFQSYQQVWKDTYQDIDEIILEHNNIPPDNWYVDRDFPAIAPEDVFSVAQAMANLIQVMPDLAYSKDVKQLALISLGINDPAAVLDELEKNNAGPASEARLINALRGFRETVNTYGNGKK